jgi:hypothetical protein
MNERGEASGNATPTGMSKLLRMWKSWKTASPAVFEGIAVALNTTRGE